MRVDQWKPEWQTANHYGYDCKVEGFPELIFIRQSHMLETLAHEIGHAFSLNHAGIGKNLLHGWGPANLMRGSIWNPGDDTNPVVDRFSLGQAYRANFHAVVVAQHGRTQKRAGHQGVHRRIGWDPPRSVPLRRSPGPAPTCSWGWPVMAPASRRCPVFLVAGAALVGSLAVVGCREPPVDRAVVDAWLTCVECGDGELDSLEAMAVRAPGTVDTLRADLLQGPSALRRARLTQQLETTYQEMAASAVHLPGADSLPLSQSEFVRRYLGNAVATYQGRAAYALGAIGGVPARAALTVALQSPPGTFPPSVLAQIQFARDSLLGP